MFLTKEEVQELTGYKIFACQVRWLTSNDWIHTRAANGRPIILRGYAERKLGGNDKIESKPEWSPNFDSLRKRQE